MNKPYTCIKFFTATDLMYKYPTVFFFAIAAARSFCSDSNFSASSGDTYGAVVICIVILPVHEIPLNSNPFKSIFPSSLIGLMRMSLIATEIVPISNDSEFCTEISKFKSSWKIMKHHSLSIHSADDADL